MARVSRIAIAMLLTAAVTGCLKVEMDLTIEGETVNGHVIGAIDQTAAQLFGMEPEDLFDQPEEEDFATLDGVTVVPYEDDDWIGVEYVFNQVSLAQLNELATGDEEFPRIIFDRQAGTYEFSLTMDFSDFAPGESEDDDVFPGLDPSALLESFDVMITVTFPGEVTEHNGQLSGTTVTWHPEIGERNEMRAVALASGSGDDPASGGDGVEAGLPASGSGGGSTSTLVALLVALAVLVVGVGGGLGLWLALRNRQPAVATASPQAPAAGGTQPDGDGTQPPGDGPTQP
jgi:hypothetical protein